METYKWDNFTSPEKEFRGEEIIVLNVKSLILSLFIEFFSNTNQSALAAIAI